MCVGEVSSLVGLFYLENPPYFESTNVLLGFTFFLFLCLMSKHKKQSHVIWNCQYHIFWCPKSFLCTNRFYKRAGWVRYSSVMRVKRLYYWWIQRSAKLLSLSRFDSSKNFRLQSMKAMPEFFVFNKSTFLECGRLINFFLPWKVKKQRKVQKSIFIIDNYIYGIIIYCSSHFFHRNRCELIRIVFN